MPRLIIAGEPGEVHENDTAKVQYQLIVSWHHSCSLCIQYDHQVGSYWPIPFHRNCNCKQTPILPGMTAQPFVDFRAKILTVPPSQQAAIMGKSNLAMVESGLVKWEDVVTPSRIRSLREVASRKRLTVDQMVGSGVTRGRADEAWNAVHTGTHTASEAARSAQVKALLAKGYTRTQVTDAAGRAIGSRIGIAEGPSGPQVVPYTPRPTPRPVPKVVARSAALKLARSKPKPAGAGVPSQKEIQARFPGHKIDPGDVATFTQHSAIKDELYHHGRDTTPVYRDGIDLKKTGGTYGRGLYVSTNHEIDYGPSYVTVALDVRNPFVGTMKEYEAELARLTGGRAADDEEVRRLFLKAGYDAVVIDFEKMYPENPDLRGVKWVSIMRPETARFSGTGRTEEPR